MNYAIGDIQGCFEAFMRLLDKVSFNPQQDHLWLLGDLVNRGPDSLATLRYCLAHQTQIHAVLGNHDLHLLSCYFNDRPPKPKDTLAEILAAPDAPHLMEWLRKQPLARYLPEFNCFLSHAGLYPDWTFETAVSYASEVSQRLAGSQAQATQLLKNIYGNMPDRWDEKLEDSYRQRFIINALTRMRFLTDDHELDLKQKGATAESKQLSPWYSKLKLAPQQKVLFGHWAALKGKCPVENVFALDTGCVWGECLSALRLEDLELISVKAFY